jgi:hypothetical protein
MAQSAVSAIKSGCQFLSEGRQQIEGFKKGVEQTIGDAKAIYGEITGIFGWIKGLLGFKAKPAAAPAKPVVASDTTEKRGSKTEKQRHEQSYEEYKAKAVHDIFQNLKTYLSAERQLQEHCQKIEEESKNSLNVSTSAIDLIEIRWQLKEMKAQVKQAMVWGTPEELGLGAMYEDFLKTQAEIMEAQAVARETKLRRERNAAWQREYRRNLTTAKVGYAVVVTLIYLEMVGLYLGLSSNTGW